MKMKKKAPTKNQVDTLCSKYVEVARCRAIVSEQYTRQLEPLEQDIIRMVDDFGQAPKNAERSKELLGELYRALVTRGISTKVDENKVTELIRLLKKYSSSQMFHRLFSVEFVHRPKPDAELFLAQIEDTRLKRELRAAFMACFELKPQNPRVKVEELEQTKPAPAGTVFTGTTVAGTATPKIRVTVKHGKGARA